jgi:hypothetical protein
LQEAIGREQSKATAPSNAAAPSNEELMEVVDIWQVATLGGGGRMTWQRK